MLCPGYMPVWRVSGLCERLFIGALDLGSGWGKVGQAEWMKTG
jgi:hypothetical protein